MNNVSCYILDPDNEYLDLTRRLGGTVVNCATGEVVINPFEVRRLRRQDEQVDDNVEADYKTV